MFLRHPSSQIGYVPVAPWPLAQPRTPLPLPTQAPCAPRTRRAHSTLPTLLLLATFLGHGILEAGHARLLTWAQHTWPGYVSLRTLAPPTCMGGPGTSAVDVKANVNADVDALLGEDDVAPSANARAAAATRCAADTAAYRSAIASITPALRAVRSIDAAITRILGWLGGHLRHLLVLLILSCAAAAAAREEHLSLRPVRGPHGSRLSATLQLIATTLLLVSWARLTDGNPLAWLWIAGLMLLAAVNARILFTEPHSAEGVRPETLADALSAVPLWAGMTVAAGVYFLCIETHPAGLAIYAQSLTEHALLYAHVGAYVWTGMLLKHTRLADTFFGLLRPWQLPPHLLAPAIVVLAAVPTAYSGASGIFVMAAGALVYNELRRAGADESTALGATAMSGSLGVVLSPCLLVVIAASLNKQVTTDALYSAGRWVLLLTATLYAVACMLSARRVERPPVDARKAMRAMRGDVISLLRYGLVIGAVIAAFRLLLGMHLDEHTAPVIMPCTMLAVLAFERYFTPGERHGEARVWRATFQTSGHVGALLLLMAASVCIGGIVQRSGVMALMPEHLGSPPLAMAVLVVVLVLVGMCMDPYGAVIVVSASIADVAYRNGIAPTHFWVVVLVAFELGYLMPPIALNQLLARRVVGLEAEHRELGRASTVPLLVMLCALLLVAFVPLGWKW